MAEELLEGRSILVKKAEVIPLEAIVRGYITGEQLLRRVVDLVFLSLRGSALAEYKKTRTVHAIPLPEGLRGSQKLPTPLFTPSTKAVQGAHDENISPEQGDVVTHFPLTRTLPPRHDANPDSYTRGQHGGGSHRCRSL
jgi:phosphoribosylaminoimidazole-succinocarboxamide synthase